MVPISIDLPKVSRNNGSHTTDRSDRLDRGVIDER